MTSVGVIEPPGGIKCRIGRSVVLEFVSWIAGSASRRIATLDHKFGNDAVKNGAVVERDAMLLLAAFGVGPILGAAGKADEILDADGRVFRKKRAGQFTLRGVDDGGRLSRRCGGCGSGFVGRRLGRGGLRD